ncbi:MAG: CBS domain-containing protein [Candidatus Enteromonas sp.]|nr:CBS domain-containing protein [Candidatus Enteromonas sp.]MEE3426672.1 CBS domain-containing protein [Candidatus Enteromonas sp.]MEE3431782.1 CBS domain-containing protein [Candidatus Enteromonas sp.]MEE3442786.1 CBS domain-containing protein [Candidatus Enteromonas sp.]
MEKNLISLLTLKKDVAYLLDDFTLRQAVEKMEYHAYAVIPVLDHASGQYLYSISEGAILYYLKSHNVAWDSLKDIPLTAVKPLRNTMPVSVRADFSVLEALIVRQNYVPVVDDKGIFIGIITRKSVMKEII